MTSRPGHKGNALTTGFCIFLLTFSWHIFSVHRPEGRNFTSRWFLDFRHRVSHFCLEPGSHIFPASICVTAAAFPWRVSHPSSWCTRLDSRTQTRMFSPPQIIVILKPTKQNMGWKWIRFCLNSSIPHICHFFYTDRIFENQILHPKKWLKSPKTLKISLKKSYICIFFTHSGKIYTWQKIFTQTCLWCLWQIKGMFKIHYG